MLNRFSKRLAYFFYENKIIDDSDDIEVYAYGLELLISSLLSIIAVLFIGIVCKQFIGAILFFVAFIPVRTFAGGYHARTHFLCFCVLIFVYSINIAMVYFVPITYIINIIIFSLIFSLLSVFLLAPVDDENKKLDEEEKKKYRKFSLRIICIQIIVVLILLILNIPIHILFSFANGQLAASTSLIAAKIKNGREDTNEKGDVSINSI